jgi:hypothetical protein
LLLSRAESPAADKLIGRCLGNGHGVIVDTRKESVLYSFAELLDNVNETQRRETDTRFKSIGREVSATCADLALRVRSASHDLTEHVSTFEDLADTLVADRRATDAALSNHHARMGRIECATAEADHQTRAKLYSIIMHLREADRIAAADRAYRAADTEHIEAIDAICAKCAADTARNAADIADLRAHARRTVDTESAVALILRAGFIALLFAVLAIYVDHEFACA